MHPKRYAPRASSKLSGNPPGKLIMGNTQSCTKYQLPNTPKPPVAGLSPLACVIVVVIVVVVVGLPEASSSGNDSGKSGGDEPVVGASPVADFESSRPSISSLSALVDISNANIFGTDSSTSCAWPCPPVAGLPVARRCVAKLGATNIGSPEGDEGGVAIWDCVTLRSLWSLATDFCNVRSSNKMSQSIVSCLRCPVLKQMSVYAALNLMNV